MEDTKDKFSRRKFIGNAAAIGALGAVGINGIISACASETKSKVALPVPLDEAPDGPLLKAGLIGCGGRGTGAALNFLNAGPNLEIVALGDLFQDQIDKAREELKDKKEVEVADEKCFVGFDAFEKVIDSGVDIIILATPPVFRAEHFDAAIKAKKHVFMEKPVAVDPVSARSIIATAKKADPLGLCVVAGTQRRHKRDYLKTYEQILNGEIGDIVAGNCYWNQSKLWHVNRDEGWTDMEYMIRNWVNWTWLSGDHIVEQHVHNIDVINWFAGKHPVKAVAFGSRLRRITGDQYDNFSVDFIYDNDMHLHSMCRQIDDCANSVSEYIRGTKGYTNCENTIYNPDGSVKWTYEYPPDENGEPTTWVKVNPYDQEHIDLITAIRTNSPINEGENVATSTLTAIMGRISAYTGKEVTWDEMMNSDLKLGPDTYVMGPMDMTPNIPLPGTAADEEQDRG
ncbi:MAG: Gfo/Idh/MocA family oxidoreductase [Bacteroidales bacterium]|nr:MAG: Gfo/Idh/MocA family oxidoreductase [Bacteroidales bacterium]